MIEFKPDIYAAYQKIMKVIYSCETKEHLDGATRMVKTFNITTKNKEMIRDLYSHLTIKKAILNR